MTRPLAVLCAATLLSACSLGPLYQAPETAMPAEWQTRVEGVGVWPDRRWWEGFRSVELDRVISDAITGNRDLSAAVQRIRQAEAQVRIAGAALAPALAGDAGAGRSWTQRGSAAGGGSASSSTYQAGLTANYQVDLFGGTAATAAAANAGLDASRFDRETVAITLRADVATTYFRLLSLRDRVRIAEETLELALDVLQLLERQRESGLSSDLETSQQRSAVAAQRGSIETLRLSERQTLDALAVLVGRAPQGFDVSGRSLGDLSLPPIAAGLPSDLLQRRPDIRKAEADLRAANLNVVAARAARFPSLNLNARSTLQAASLSAVVDGATLVSSIAGSLTAPIFDAGRLKSQEELSAARFQELAERYQGAILAALRDTEDALAATDASGRQYDLARIAYEQAREAYRIIDARFRAGTITFLNVLDAQRTVFQSSDALAQASLARYVGLVGLYKALGGGWEGP
jgi:multidrug efflux system outer membrane protein